MKKLMIAVAAAAMVGGAFAGGACDWNPGSDPVTGTAWVYTWKFTGKTAVGAPVSTTGSKATVSGCDFVPGFAGASCVIRVPGSLAIKGYTYLCDPECAVDDYNQFKEDAWEFLNSVKKDAGISFYMTKPYKDIVKAEFKTAVANVIGREGGKFELAGDATFTSLNTPAEEFVLTYAGFGKYNQSKQRVTSVSGNFAGTAKQPYYVPTAAQIKSGKAECLPAIVWDCAVVNWIDDETSIAYGNFSVKFNADAAAKFYAGKGYVALPSWTSALIMKAE